MVELTGFYALVYSVGLFTLGIICAAFIGLLFYIIVGIFEKVVIFLDILFSKRK